MKEGAQVTFRKYATKAASLRWRDNHGTAHLLPLKVQVA